MAGVRKGTPLTNREREIMELVLEGQLTKQIAETLGLSPKTVEQYRARIKVRYGANNMVTLIQSYLADRSSSPPAVPVVQATPASVAAPKTVEMTVRARTPARIRALSGGASGRLYRRRPR